MKKKMIVLTLSTVALSFGLGALSPGVISQLRAEFEAREFRELVNRDVMAGISPSGREYFQGRADAAGAASRLDYSRQFLPEYLMGFGDGLTQAAWLVAAAP